MRAIDRTALVKRHPGKWVALKPDRKTVIATGSSLEAVRSGAKRQGTKRPVLIRLPKRLRSFVGPTFS